MRWKRASDRLFRRRIRFRWSELSKPFLGLAALPRPDRPPRASRRCPNNSRQRFRGARSVRVVLLDRSATGLEVYLPPTPDRSKPAMKLPRNVAFILASQAPTYTPCSAVLMNILVVE